MTAVWPITGLILQQETLHLGGIVVVAVHVHVDLGLNLSGELRVSLAHLVVRGVHGDALWSKVNDLLFDEFNILLGVDSNLLEYY
jgi:hypothetical protein